MGPFKYYISILAPLAHCFNLSIKKSTYPENLSLIKVKPLHKKDDRLNPANYRGINLTTNFSKIFEQLFKTRLINFLEITQIMHPNQHGFTKEKSINTAIKQVLKFIDKKTYEKKPVLLLPLDLTRAFDTVDHKLLLQKLNNYGIRNENLKWVESYLKNKKQQVEVQYTNPDTKIKSKVLSNAAPIKAGTFQGTILAPDLFKIQLNDFFYNFKSGDDALHAAFADDILPVITANNTKELLQKADNILVEMHEWFTDNSLNINFNKSSFMLINKKESDNLINHDLKNLKMLNTITNVDSIKYLGIFIDNDLTWDSHIEYLTSQLNELLHLFRITKNHLSDSYLLQLYHALFASKLSYGVRFWGRSNKIEQILICQKKCLRIIFNLRDNETCREIFKEYNILTVVSMYILGLCTDVFNNFSDYSKNSNIHSHNTRNSEKLHINAKATEIEYEELVIFNHLPTQLTSNNLSQNQFKKKLKETLLNHSFYKVQEFLNFKF